jgi:hypothetical protein
MKKLRLIFATLILNAQMQAANPDAFCNQPLFVALKAACEFGGGCAVLSCAMGALCADMPVLAAEYYSLGEKFAAFSALVGCGAFCSMRAGNSSEHDMDLDLDYNDMELSAPMQYAVQGPRVLRRRGKQRPDGEQASRGLDLESMR